MCLFLKFEKSWGSSEISRVWCCLSAGLGCDVKSCRWKGPSAGRKQQRRNKGIQQVESETELLLMVIEAEEDVFGKEITYLSLFSLIKRKGGVYDGGGRADLYSNTLPAQRELLLFI